MTGPRWAGVPVTMESGKRMGAARKRIVGDVPPPATRALCDERAAPHQPGRLHARAAATASRSSSTPRSRLRGRGRGAHVLVLPLREGREGAVRRGVREAALRRLRAATRRCSSRRARSTRAGASSTRSSTAGQTGLVPLETLRAGHRQTSWRAADGRSARPTGVAGRVGRRRSRQDGRRARAQPARPRLARRGLEPHARRSPRRWRPRGSWPRRRCASSVAALAPPRVIWLMVPAGAPVDALLFGADGDGAGGLAALLAPGDTVIDGGNSHFCATPRRAPSGSPSSASTSSTAGRAAAPQARATARA